MFCNILEMASDVDRVGVEKLGEGVWWGVSRRWRREG